MSDTVDQLEELLNPVPEVVSEVMPGAKVVQSIPPRGIIIE